MAGSNRKSIMVGAGAQGGASKAQDTASFKSVKPLYIAQAKIPYTAEQDDELNMQVGDLIKVLNEDTDEEGWVEGFNTRTGQLGFLPLNYINKVVGPGGASAPNLPKIRCSVINKQPQTIQIDMSDAEKLDAPFGCAVNRAYRAEQNDEHSLVEGESLWITHRHTVDEGWFYGLRFGKGELKLLPIDCCTRTKQTFADIQKAETSKVMPIRQSKIFKNPINTFKPAENTPMQYKKFPKGTYYIANDDAEVENDDELEFKKGDIIEAFQETEDEGWYLGALRGSNDAPKVFCSEICKRYHEPSQQSASPAKSAAAAPQQKPPTAAATPNKAIRKSVMNKNLPSAKAVSPSSPKSGNDFYGSLSDAVQDSNDQLEPHRTLPQPIKCKVILNNEVENDDELQLTVGRIVYLTAELTEEDPGTFYYGHFEGDKKIGVVCKEFLKEIIEEKPKPHSNVVLRQSQRKSKQQPPQTSSHPPAAAAKPLPAVHEQPKQHQPAAPAAKPAHPSSPQQTQPSPNVNLDAIKALIENKIKEIAQNFESKLDQVRHQHATELSSLQNQLTEFKEKLVTNEAIIKDVNDLLENTSAMLVKIDSKITDHDKKINEIKPADDAAKISQADWEGQTNRAARIKNTVINMQKDAIALKSQVEDCLAKNKTQSRKLTSIEAKMTKLIENP